MAPWPPILPAWQRTLLAASEQAKNQRTLNVHLGFEAHAPRAKASEPKHLIELGVQIIVGVSPVVTYFLVIGKPSDKGRIGLRKMHFDRDFAVNQQEAKPGMHIQFGGGKPPPLSDYLFDDCSQKLEKPRIPCFPKSFALLVHLALLEYHSTDERLEKLLLDPRWTSIVKASEEAVLKPHIEYCREWMRSAKNESSSLFSHFYGLPRL